VGGGLILNFEAVENVRYYSHKRPERQRDSAKRQSKVDHTFVRALFAPASRRNIQEKGQKLASEEGRHLRLERQTREKNS